MTEEKKEMEYIAHDWLNESEFPVNDNYEIEYKESELNNFLKELKKEGYSEEEIKYFEKCVENFSKEREEEVYDTVEFETPSGGKDWYEKNYRVETVILTSKKIA